MTGRKPISKITGTKGEIMKLLNNNVELAVLEDGTTFSSLKGSVVMVLTEEEHTRLIDQYDGDVREARAVMTIDLEALVHQYLKTLTAPKTNPPGTPDATIYVMDGGVVGVDCIGARVTVRNYDEGRNIEDLRTGPATDDPLAKGSVGVFYDSDIGKPFTEETYVNTPFSMEGYVPHPD